MSPWCADNLIIASFQIATSIPLVSDRQDLAILKKEYAEDDSIYQQKIRVRFYIPAWIIILVFIIIIVLYYAEVSANTHT